MSRPSAGQLDALLTHRHVLVTGERRLIERADEIIVMVDSSKFDGPSLIA
jgi:DeoR/GlpR family transcriptional regulator of sugar metabolism